ncbi:5-formyltetrahydrofolate cyclo-ligase [Acidocella sp.]|jgi:5-formyltetrahydrofolate cyclo-ligase|uniref:5-formyltetrahydrofolate cyclo-ligase n=1 Tax=Acidocella sp. TaxID=50710 RepID=UPI002624A409|nr:5-formyltetrahydrofolate cyclo-ligase [Acidocella sp.]
MSAADPAAAKTALRGRMRALRAGLDAARGRDLARHVLASGLIPAGAVVAGFLPMRGEIDILPLLEALRARGHRLALPETPPPGAPLTFHAWTPGAPLRPGRYGTRHPEGEALTPEVLLVPLLAFDARGHRLGYGGGYYDRSLAALPRALAIGCAYAAQEVAELPAEPTDMPLDAVATETGIKRFHRQG